jgi:hypothetical protein
MSKLKLILTGLLVAASVVMTAAIERRSARRQDEQAGILKEQEAQFAYAAEENARLSNLVAQAATTPPLSPEQLRDLLRLRNEVGQLRKLEGQKPVLEATNAQLREMDEKSRAALARARALPNYWPKDQLAFAGYGDPVSAARSFLAAMKNGDLKAMLDCFDPTMAAGMEAELKKEGGDPAAKEAETKSMLSDFLEGADGFHIIDQATTASNEVTVNISFDGAGQVRKMVFKQIGNDWKFVDGF